MKEDEFRLADFQSKKADTIFLKQTSPYHITMTTSGDNDDLDALFGAFDGDGQDQKSTSSRKVGDGAENDHDEPESKMARLENDVRRKERDDDDDDDDGGPNDNDRHNEQVVSCLCFGHEPTFNLEPSPYYHGNNNSNRKETRRKTGGGESRDCDRNITRQISSLLHGISKEHSSRPHCQISRHASRRTCQNVRL